MKDDLNIQLNKNLIPFWLKLCDKQYGGIHNFMDSSGRIDRKYNKSTILQTRALWFFSSVNPYTTNTDVENAAKSCFDFLTKFIILADGSIIKSVSYDGKIIDDTKNLYFHAFAIYALMAYFENFQDIKAKTYAISIYNYIENTFKDNIGYIEQIGYQKNIIADKGVDCDRTMNSLLHLVEAYTVLYKGTKQDNIKNSLLRLIDIFAQKIYNPKMERLEVFFDNRMNSVSNYHSYGHDIEAAWLLDYAVSVLDDKDYKNKIYPITDMICKNISLIALDGQVLKNEMIENKVDNDRIWWVQAEGVLGFYKNYLRTNNIEYKNIAISLYDFIKSNFITKFGEWYWKLNENNIPDLSLPLVSDWKCPYHNGRMIILLLDVLGNKHLFSKGNEYGYADNKNV